MGNIGDSRVLLGRADGSIFPGPGTDSGLTTDRWEPEKRTENLRRIVTQLSKYDTLVLSLIFLDFP